MFGFCFVFGVCESFVCFLFLHCFKTGFCYVVQAGLKIVVQCIFKLIITLPQSPKHLVKSVYCGPCSLSCLKTLCADEAGLEGLVTLSPMSPLLKRKGCASSDSFFLTTAAFICNIIFPAGDHAPSTQVFLEIN